MQGAFECFEGNFDSFGGNPLFPFKEIPNCLCTTPLSLIVQFKLSNRFIFVFACSSCHSCVCYRVIHHQVTTTSAIDVFGSSSSVSELQQLLQNKLSLKGSGAKEGGLKGKLAGQSDNSIKEKSAIATTGHQFASGRLAFYYLSDNDSAYEYEQSLLEKYKQHNEIISGKEGEWENESYEADKHKYFYKYQEFVQEYPGCLIRYEFGGNPLWYTTKMTVPPCKCGSRRVFEFQILSTLIPKLGIDDTDSNQLDFGTIIVFVCENDCSDGQEYSFMSEHVVLQRESQKK